MNVIKSKDVINILKRALNLIDERLINHGERVGYIIYKMMEYENKYSQQEMLDYTISALFHDIGAYKTDEIDNMIKFETRNIWEHSIYGYLFFKYLTPLNDLAETILFHHIDYSKLTDFRSKHEVISSYLNLADRIDVNKITSKDIVPEKFYRLRDVQYSGQALDLFHNAQLRYHILEKLEDKSYQEELNQFLGKAVFTSVEKEQFLQMLIYSIDFRSEHTVRHTITTVSVADQLGRLMGLNDKDTYNLHYGALLHDIGKISTPLNILEAPRGLSAEEMGVMKNHVAVSELILKDYIDEEIVQIAVRHHEKLDGSGYHKGLTADQLTLPQRILAVADIISALYGVRSYKTSFNKEKILSILTKEADKGMIDAEVVDCVNRFYDTLMENVEKDCKEPLQKYSAMNERYESLYIQFLELI